MNHLYLSFLNLNKYYFLRFLKYTINFQGELETKRYTRPSFFLSSRKKRTQVFCPKAKLVFESNFSKRMWKTRVKHSLVFCYIRVKKVTSNTEILTREVPTYLFTCKKKDRKSIFLFKSFSVTNSSFLNDVVDKCDFLRS